jgi:hypothetical protein
VGDEFVRPESERKVIQFVPSDRPRDRIYRYVIAELFTLDVWETLFTERGQELPKEARERQTALNDILNLVNHLEAAELKRIEEQREREAKAANKGKR